MRVKAGLLQLPSWLSFFTSLLHGVPTCPFGSCPRLSQKESLLGSKTKVSSLVAPLSETFPEMDMIKYPTAVSIRNCTSRGSFSVNSFSNSRLG